MAARLKVHRRTVRLDGTSFTVLSLRPGDGPRFATNSFHQAWHVLASPEDGRLFGRLLWAMAYQRRPNTVFVIDPGFLVPNPFDADPSSPIVLHNPDTGPFTRAQADDLRAALPWRTASEGTVTLQTHGLDERLAFDADDDAEPEPEDPAVWNPHQQRAWIERSNGLVIVAAPRWVLEGWAVHTQQLGRSMYQGNDYAELDWHVTKPYWGEGEVQVFERFAERVASAVEARERLFPGRGHAELRQDEREQVWNAPRGS